MVWDAIVYATSTTRRLQGQRLALAEIRDPDSDGDNLFPSSIVAVDADTGSYKWHYQTTPRDMWDYTATQPCCRTAPGCRWRATPGGDGAPKNGFYVLDAATGELISADAFTDMTWATGIDENGRPIEVPEARSLEEDFVVLLCAHWRPAPCPTARTPGWCTSPPTSGPWPTAIRTRITRSRAIGTLVTARMRAGPWNSPGWHRRSARDGRRLPAGPRPGQGERAGPYPSRFLSTAAPCRWPVACSRPTRRVNWWPTTPRPVSGFGPTVWSGAPVRRLTYEVDGEQYISILSGWGSTIAMVYGVVFEDAVGPETGRVITFKVGGNGELPKPLQTGIARTPKSAPIGDEAQHSKGLTLFAANCQWCHGAFAVSSGVFRPALVSHDGHRKRL